MSIFGENRLKDIKKVVVLGEGIRRWWKFRRRPNGKLGCWW